MATKTILMVGIHNHQPVGNFDKVFEFTFDHAYETLLDHLDRHRKVKVALHYTGPLLEWLEEKRPAFLDRIRGVVERGQAEMMSGGFYEPILTVLPPSDAIAQLAMLNGYVRKRFGYEPKGFWLAERVWEPGIPTLAHEAGGLRYTVLDQSHFLSSGIGKDDANGYYMTEDSGNPLAVFPIDYQLRYYIPWEPVTKTIEYLRAKHDAHPGRGWTFADDGEKFGGWPETWENVIQKGWFEDWFAAIEDAGDWLETRTFSEFLSTQAPSGRVYLPTSSYPEMMRWSLPTPTGRRIEEFLDSLPEGDDREFVQAGFWRNFMAKYPEANTMHKRMILASRRVSAAEKKRTKSGDGDHMSEARKHVLRSQCNCPYWHGVFGGLYLNFLRHATYAELLAGEVAAHPVKGLEAAVDDFDADGRPEIIVENPEQVLIFSPHQGGALREWDWRAFPTNLIDTMARRPEVYHDRKRVKLPAKFMENFTEKVAYDRYNRWCMIDIFPPWGTTLDAFQDSAYRDEGDFAGAEYTYELKSGKATADILFLREGAIRRPEGTWPIAIEKRIVVEKDKPGMEVTIALVNRGDRVIETSFGSEWNLGLLAAWADDRYYLVDGRRGPGDMRLGTKGESRDVHEIALLDHWQQVDIRLAFSEPAKIWRYPVETLSLSEEGFERTYQGSAVFPHWVVAIPPGGRWEVRVGVDVRVPEWHPPEA